MKEFLAFILLFLLVVAGYEYSYLSLDLATFLAFILIVGLLIYRDRKKVKLEGIIFIRRTKKGRDFIDRTATSHRSFWGTYGTLGVAIMIPVLLLGSVFMVNQAAKIAGGEREGGVRLLLPGPVSAPVNAPGAFIVPWWIWVIGVAAVIIPHEFMHGIMCRLDKIRIKSVGWILLLVIPGAFVEPDEAQLKKAPRRTKMRVYAAGSFANVTMAVIVLAAMIIMSSANFSPAGVFAVTQNGTPAAAFGEVVTISAIDNYQVRSGEDLRLALSNYNPGDAVTVYTLDGDTIGPRFVLSGLDFFTPKPVVITNTTQPVGHTLTLASHNETGRAYLGVSVLFSSVSFTGNDFELFQNAAVLLLWIYIFSLGIGIVNILPIKPLDGGLLFEEIIGHFAPKNQSIIKAVSAVMLLVVLFNLLGPVFL